MEKRGQTTLFIILGIVIVIIVVLFFVLRSAGVVPSLTQSAEDIIMQVDDEVTECMEEASDDVIDKIALQGGYLDTPDGSYRLWDDYAVSYLCYNSPGEAQCVNRLLTLESMEESISEAIEEQLRGCVDIYGIDKSIDAGSDFDVETSIAPETVTVTLDFPVSVVKGDQVASRETFEISVNKPLGELYEVAMDIVNYEATDGYFDVVFYVVSKMGEYTIYPYKPYPDKLYQVKMREGDFIFQFAIEGEEL